MTSDYHHGDLPTALRAAAVELISESGPNGFSLREVARRAGVSHSAPAHHFGDTQGLLTSVAAEGFAVLSTNMAQVAGIESPRERFVALGAIYLDTALSNPGHYGVMIGHDFTDEEDESLIVASVAAYTVLQETILALRDEYNPSLSDLDVDKTATLVWATVHGLVELAPILGHVADKTLSSNNELHDLLERFADMVIDGLQK